MKVSNLFLATLKDSPNDAEISSHKLMIRAAMIRKLASGLYTWLPLGLRVLRKVEKIVREEMDRIGAQEIVMPAIQPAELWIETGRWDQYGPNLLRIEDRHKRNFCFGPTHEEVITDLVRREIRSYKQLPITFYQIQTKFRDEIRPRFGVMRAREFLMKDAYSFNLDKESLQQSYDAMYQAYTQIFTRLGLKFRAVLADTGSIGGTFSHEFQVLADAGEDLIAYSTESDYAANVELAKPLSVSTPRPKPNKELSFVTTPNIKTVEGQAEHLGVQTKDILKTMLVRGKTEEHLIVALLIRGDHQLNAIKAEKHPLVASPLTLITPEELKEIANCSPGFVGPLNLKTATKAIPLVADPDAAHMANFICGANKDDTHHAGFNWGRDCVEPEVFDLRSVVEGDKSPDGKGTLKLTRGIEVGHIFQLGTKYSEAMNANVLDESGKARTLLMGCYGIGVSRIVAAAIEQNYDEKGIVWPAPLAPFQVSLIPIGLKRSEAVQRSIEKLYNSLQKAGIEVLLDDRDERPGVMFADSELIGIPHRIVIGEKNLANGMLEYKARISDESKLIPEDTIVEFLSGLSKS